MTTTIGATGTSTTATTTTNQTRQMRVQIPKQENEKVGEFYFHRVHSPTEIEKPLTPLSMLFLSSVTSSDGEGTSSSANNKPIVINFYAHGCGGSCAIQMEEWAQTIPQAATFLCICVQDDDDDDNAAAAGAETSPKDVAIEFHTKYKFDKVINGYIPAKEYMPVGYGQLGCNGFVIVDKYGYFISKRTRSYLQDGMKAFEYVESMLAKVNQQCRVVTTLTESAILNRRSKKRTVSEVDEDLIMTEETAGKDEQEEETIHNTTTKTVVIQESASLPKQDLSQVSFPVGEVEARDVLDETKMDWGRKLCLQAFNEVVRNPCWEMLQNLYHALKGHFIHEEEFLRQLPSSTNDEKKKTSTSKDKKSTSAIKSHLYDQRRILDIAKLEMHRMQQQQQQHSNRLISDNEKDGDEEQQQSPTAILESPSNQEQQPRPPTASATTTATVDLKVILALATSFHAHTEQYDWKYKSRISMSSSSLPSNNAKQN